MIKFYKNIPEIIATAFILFQFMSLLFFKEVNNATIIYDTCLLISFELIFLMANVFLSILYEYFWGLLFCVIGFGLFFYFFYQMMANPEEIKNIIIAFILTHSIGFVSYLYFFYKNKKKTFTTNSYIKTMNYAIKLVIYFVLFVFVIITIEILPQGILTENHLKDLNYINFINSKGHGGSGLITNPNVTLWLGILYYLSMLIIQISQLKHRESDILELFFMTFKKRAVK